MHGRAPFSSPVKVEILLSGLWDPSSGNLFAEEGDQQRFWKITRKFVEQMAAVSGSKVKAVRASNSNVSRMSVIPLCFQSCVLKSNLRDGCLVHLVPGRTIMRSVTWDLQLYPDMGVAAMLRNEWKDCSFGIAAINERSACTEEDELLIIAAADPQGMLCAATSP